MIDLVVYGAGGFGREIACLIHEINLKNSEPLWNFIGFFDDGKQIGDRNEYGVILGGINELNLYSKKLAVVLAIGNPNTLAFLEGRIKNSLVEFPNIIAPDIRYLDKNNTAIGKGNIFFSKCSLSCNVSIGDFNIFNSTIAVGHDTRIGSFNLFMPGTRISGDVEIGELNFLGVNSIILQKTKIGNKTVISAGSVVIRNTKDNSTYLGNPARKLDL
jgi:sugar O-acyltransferase (sialic acid O-acetyltransferase NeuD family)